MITCTTSEDLVTNNCLWKVCYHMVKVGFFLFWLILVGIVFIQEVPLLKISSTNILCSGNIAFSCCSRFWLSESSLSRSMFVSDTDIVSSPDCRSFPH